MADAKAEAETDAEAEAEADGNQNRAALPASTSAPTPARARALALAHTAAAAAKIFSSKSFAPSTSSSQPPPPPPASLPTRGSLPTPRPPQRHSRPPSSSLPLPKISGKAIKTRTRIKTKITPAAASKTGLHPSSDPYDLDSVVWDDEQEAEQDQEQGQEQNMRTQSKIRSTVATQSAPGQKELATTQGDETCYYEVERILDFRRANLESKSESEPELADTDEIELLVHWAGYDDEGDYTWEDEEDLQLAARDAVLGFWKTHPAGGRDAALGIDAEGADSMSYRVLRVVGGPKVSRNKATGESTAKGGKTRAKTKKKTGKKQAQAGNEEETTVELFRVEWVGYAEKTWEPSENLPEDMVQAYLDDQQARRSKKRKRIGDGDD